MAYLGDFAASAILDFKFSTHAADGTPTTLSGTPVVKVYKGNATTTEVTTGVTLTADFDAITGLNHVRIDTVDGFYATGNDFQVVVTTGTVAGISVVGRVVAEFSIEHRSVGSGTAPSATTVAAAVWDRLLTAITTTSSIGKLLKDDIDATITSRASQTSVDTIDDFLDTEVAAIKAKTDLLAFTSGNIHADIKAYNAIAIVTATVVTDAGNTALTFKTDRTEAATDYWKDAFWRFNTGALVGQCHRVTGYNGTTKFLTFTTAFTGIPVAGVTGEFINR